MHTFFEGIFTTSTITVTNFLLCLFVSLAIGMFLALIYDRKLCSRSFLVTLALLPAVVCVVIMMVNGNVGAGVASQVPSPSSASVLYPARHGKSQHCFLPWQQV